MLNARRRILKALLEGEKTSWQLARVGGIRFNARIFELRQRGYKIEYHRRHGKKPARYYLDEFYVYGI